MADARATGGTMKAAIAIDDWKLTIFEQHLTQAGYSYVKHPGVTKNSLTLTVVTDDMDALQIVVKAANTEAALSKSSQENKTWH